MTVVSTNRKLRLLVIASTYPRWKNDPEPAFVHELSKRLTDRFEVFALCPHAPGAAVEDVLDGVRVVRYRYAPTRWETLVNDGGIISNLQRKPWKWLLLPGFLVGLAWSAWRLVRTLRPDVIHAHWLLPQGLVVALLGVFDRRVPPFLVTSHGADLFALRTRPLQVLKRFVARRSSAIAVVSAAMRDELVRIGVTSNKISVQPMGTDLTERFTPDSSVARSRNEILFVGRLVEKKGLSHLIDAMPAVLHVRPTAFLTVAGFGPEDKERRAQVKRLRLQDKVNFIGAVLHNELPALYRRAAVFVAPFIQASSGDREGLGLVLVEAAGCGCPVVTSDFPAVRDVFKVGQAGVVSPGSASAIGEAVCEVLRAAPRPSALEMDLRSSLRAKFDWLVVSGSYARTIKQLVDSQQGRK